MENKGREFRGMLGGANYRKISALFGMGPKFYRKGLGSIALGPGMRALDLGCGPGALSFALAGRAHHASSITGIDLSDDQLHYAKRFSGNYRCGLDFRKNSMDELLFPDGHFDLVMTSMAIHETPPEVRRGAIREAARVLKPDGTFLLVDWGRPKLGLWGIVWFPFVRFGEMNRDNWNNVYPALCRQCGLEQVEDSYITSLVRRQAFIKRDGDARRPAC